MLIVRQSTARAVMVGPVLDADGVAVTDCVVADFEGSVNGGDPAALNGSATLTHRGVGFYSLALTATDLATVGSFEVTINDTVNACPMKELVVVEEAVYDALFVASAPGYVANAPVNVAQFGGSNGTFSSGRPEVNTSHAAGTAWNSGAITANTLASDTIAAAKIATGAITSAKFAAGAIDAAAIATDAIGSAEISAAAVTKIQAGLSTLTQTQVSGGAYALNSASFAFNAALDFTTAQKAATLARVTLVDTTTTLTNLPAITANWLTAAGTAADFTTEIQSGLATAANLATVAGYLDTEIAAILADTNELQTDWADGGRLDLILDARASQASVDTIDSEVGVIDGIVDAIKVVTDKIDDTLEDDAGTYRFTANALEEGPTGGGGGDATEAKQDTIIAALATVDNVVDAILVDTAEIGVAGAGLTVLSTAAELAKVPKSDSNVTWNATALASIQTEANDAIVANNLDHLILSAVDTNFATTVHANSVIGHLADNGAGFDRTTDSLEAIRDRGDAAWITATGFSTHSAADAGAAVLDVAISGHLGAGTVGDAIYVAATRTVSTHSATDVWAAGVRTLTSLAGLTVDTVTTLTNLPSIPANWLTAAGTHADFTTEIQSGLATAASLATVAGYLDTEIAAILEDTGTTLPAQIAALNNLSAAQVNAEVDTALADYDGPTNAEMEARTLAAASYATSAAQATAQTSIDDLPTNAELATSQAAADDATLAAIAALSIPTADANAAALLDLANGVESGKTVRQALRIIAAALAGKRSNAGTGTEQYDAIGNPGTARVVGNLDAAGDGTPTLTP